MIKPKTKSPRKPRLKITNEITNKIQKLRAKDETNKQTKTQTHKRNKKQKNTKNNKTQSCFVTGKKQMSVFTDAVV